jgi:hypothetical protein
MEKLKSSRLSQTCVVSLPPVSISNNVSKYEADVKDSVVSNFKFTGIMNDHDR